MSEPLLPGTPSLPGPPTRVLSPPKGRRSLPPRTQSLPSPPKRLSLPPRAKSASLAPLPRRLSAPLVPFKVSGPGPPILVTARATPLATTSVAAIIVKRRMSRRILPPFLKAGVRHPTSTAVTKKAYSPGGGRASPIWTIFVCHVATFWDRIRRMPKRRSSQNTYSTHFVNKLRQAPSQAPSDHTGSRIACGLLRGLLLLSVLAREVRRPVHDDQNNRHHAPQRCIQPSLAHRVCS